MTIPNLDKDPTGQTWLLQTALASIGYPVTPDNWRGTKTDSALAEFKASITPSDHPPLPAGPKAPLPATDGLVLNEWPKEADAAAFFGYPANLTQIETPYPMRMFTDKWEPISHISCNLKVAASLRRCLGAILSHFGSLDEIKKVGADVYDGCYNDRSIRGSTRRSMHAYGAAIDMDAEHNPLGATKGTMSPAVVAIFKAEGWRWGGDYTNRKDWMHFEACR